jgi:hypothetical protein
MRTTWTTRGTCEVTDPLRAVVTSDDQPTRIDLAVTEAQRATIDAASPGTLFDLDIDGEADESGDMVRGRVVGLAPVTDGDVREALREYVRIITGRD